MGIDEQLKLLKCVSDKTRLEILHLLKKGERCVYDIVNETKLEQSLVSHHLREMRKCKIVNTRREGKKIFYRITDNSIIKFLDEVKLLSRKFCD
ncbi:MAG: metalloregulator ArsR/SmtB family transcription factor [Candidatus Hadarchaeum sp.]